MSNKSEKTNRVNPTVWLVISLIVFLPMFIFVSDMSSGGDFMRNSTTLTKLILFIAALSVVVNIWRVVKSRLK
jgi:hypothetical protein